MGKIEFLLGSSTSFQQAIAPEIVPESKDHLLDWSVTRGSHPQREDFLALCTWDNYTLVEEVHITNAKPLQRRHTLYLILFSLTKHRCNGSTTYSAYPPTGTLLLSCVFATIGLGLCELFTWFPGLGRPFCLVTMSTASVKARWIILPGFAC